MYIVVGLGNPGEKYAHTRHNAGRLAAELVEKKTIPDVKVITPDTYMNETGTFVRKFVRSEEEAKRLIVLADDIDSPLGSLKIQVNRGSGGHHGYESIENHLGTKEFIKMKIGVLPKNLFGQVKKPKGEGKVEKFILSDFRSSEMKMLNEVAERAAQAVEVIVREGVQSAQNKFNS